MTVSIENGVVAVVTDGRGNVLAQAPVTRQQAADIRKQAAGDFAHLKMLYPALEVVGINGQTSGKFAPAGYRTVVLPSSSPAYMAMGVEEKRERWRQLLD